MKYIITILFIFSYAVCFSQVKIGADGAMHPTGNYPATLMREVKAFALAEPTIAARNNIPDNFRDTGMMVLVLEDSTLYTLVGGTGDGNWQPFLFGGTGGPSTIIIDSAIVDLNGLQPIIEIPLNLSGFKTLSVISEGEDASGFKTSFSTSSAFLKWQVALLGTFKFYVIYYF